MNMDVKRVERRGTGGKIVQKVQILLDRNVRIRVKCHMTVISVIKKPPVGRFFGHKVVLPFTQLQSGSK